MEIDLDGTALVLTVESIVDLHVDLGTIEGTVTVVEGPGLTEGVKSLLKSGLSLVPKFIRTESVLGASRKLELKSEAENTVDVHQEVKSVVYLLLDLLRRAEDMCVILLESANTDQTTESS